MIDALPRSLHLTIPGRAVSGNAAFRYTRRTALQVAAMQLYRGGVEVDTIARQFGVCRATIHAWARKEGLYREQPWTAWEDAYLTSWYRMRSEKHLDRPALAKRLKRSEAAVACRANELGVTERRREPSEETRERNRQTQKLKLAFGYTHPRGMLGKTHTPEMRAQFSAQRIGKPLGPLSPEIRKAMSKRMSVRLQQNPHTVYSKSHASRRADLGGQFFRSQWEANIARWLNFQGIKWQYEPKTFWFEKIRRGVRSYTPDFYLPDEDRYIEVKGWMDPKSKTKLKRMAKYYPKVKIEVLGADRYKGILQACARAIPTWEGRK